MDMQRTQLLREIRNYICENCTDGDGDYAPTEQEEIWMSLLDQLIAEIRVR